MDWERRSIRVCGAAVACAVLLRLLGGGIPAVALEPKQWAAFLLYLETGRIYREPAGTQPAPAPETQAPSEPLVLTEADLAPVEIKYSCSYRPDLEELLDSAPTLNLRGDGPGVLILHTHTTESYTKQSEDSYVETSDYRTLDESYNMLAVGDAIARRLEEAGVEVIHDRSFHDYPSYNGSYNDARECTEAYLEQYPSIRLVLDVHRDAVEVDGGQLDTQAQVKGKESAQLMFVVGSDEGGLTHPDWVDNLALALRLDAALEKLYPGLCRPMSFRSERYNQHLSPGAMLVEVGSAGNTLEEALTAADALCDGILALWP